MQDRDQIDFKVSILTSGYRVSEGLSKFGVTPSGGGPAGAKVLAIANRDVLRCAISGYEQSRLRM
jgi:hypothetical protein